ncbi:MAG TPA: DUF2007 domain-containing protein [Syntrophales bacterium]|nr:DUF2007 domain-containing protein [Syntrophales bacterium]
MDEEKWEVACRASGMTNANIMAGRLETEGIPTRLRYEAVGAIYVITIDGLGEVEIMVPEGLLDKAREVLSQSYDDKDMDWEGSC